MKKLHARLVLWVIRPALNLRDRRALDKTSAFVAGRFECRDHADRVLWPMSKAGGFEFNLCDASPSKGSTGPKEVS